MADGKYQPAKALEYNEFVGELRPGNDRAFTEVHVRYGVRKNLYLDWSITLRARLGDLREYLALESPQKTLERRTLEVVEVADSAIVRRTFNPYQPDEPPRTTVLMPLYPGDGAKVDALYDENMRGLTHNILVCLDNDLSEMVIPERSLYYFPEVSSTVGVLLSDNIMKFLKIERGGTVAPDDRSAATEDDAVDGPVTATGGTTMGMLVDSIYAGDWTDQIDDFLGGSEP
jgi:hypothetical protein